MPKVRNTSRERVLYRECHTSFSLAKSSMDEKSKISRSSSESFKNFPLFLRLLINLNRNEALQKKGMEIAIF